MLLQEMAQTLPDAMDRCYALGVKFIEHFHKAYNEPNCPATNHWLKEMQNWFNDVKNIKLKTTNKILLNRQINDWFFTATSFPEDIVDMDLDEQIIYDKFCTLLLNNLNVKKSFEEVIK